MTAALWSDVTATRATGGAASGMPWRATGVVIDSRALTGGELFVALTGEHVDGHDFVGAALASGAVAAMVERRPANLSEHAPLLIVEDTLKALTYLGTQARAGSTAQVVAVTGSVGKTGTKEALLRGLSVADETYASAGNLNNHIGAPLSLSRLPRSAVYAVLELGMNHAGEIALLSRMVRPHVAIVTNVEPVHIGYFDSERDIALAKAEIFQGLEPGGVAVLNLDNPWYPVLAEQAHEAGAVRVVTFGRAKNSHIRLIDTQSGPDGSRVDVEIEGRPLRYQLDAIGVHWALNSTGVLACVHALGLDVEASAAAIRQVSASRGRGGQVIINLAGGGAIRLIDESYNASPTAMRAAFSVLGFSASANHGSARGAGTGSPKGRRIAVLGDMRELGDSGPELHAALAEDLLAAAPDAVFTIGPLMRELCARLPDEMCAGRGERSADIAEQIAAELRAGDVVLVKGSLGTNMRPIIAAIEALGKPRRSMANGR
jgi:UDP-N-acetylmuramoyl-tripeptide--D-alanyl-D-alanine ligase